MSEPDGPVVILATAPDGATAETIARTLVEERLAACVTRLPGVRSIYRWRGSVETAEEVQLLVKTRASVAARAVDRIRDLHPYEVPEALVLPVAGGLDRYLAWIEAETPSGGEGL